MVKVKVKLPSKIVYKIKPKAKVKSSGSNAKKPSKVYIRDGNIKYQIA